MMSEIVKFSGSGNPYRHESELVVKLLDVIYEYNGMMSTVSVIGVLELVKDQIKLDAQQ